MAARLHFVVRMLLLHRPFTAALLAMACSAAGMFWGADLALRIASVPNLSLVSASAPAALPAPTGACRFRSPDVNVVDVTAAAPPELIAQLLRLAPDERVTSIDDRRMESDLAAGAWLASRRRASGGYIDVAIEGANHSRRVLVLLH